MYLVSGDQRIRFIPISNSLVVKLCKQAFVLRLFLGIRPSVFFFVFFFFLLSLSDSLGNKQISNSRLCESSKCWVYSAVNHAWWMSMLFHPWGLLWLFSAVRYIWWQRWDNDNCQTGVALLMSSPVQDSGRVFSEGEVM